MNGQWPADSVERRPVSALVPYARNSRTHSDAQVAQIAASIREWGWTTPVLVDEDGTIIAGHGRVLAAQKLGIDEVPCMVARGWTEAQRRAYVIADNKLALNAGWDDEMLRVELGELRDLDFDLDLTGFGEEELGLFDAEEVEPPALADGDRAPFRQATFTLHDEQWEEVEAAIAKAKSEGAGESPINENSNGNALAWICGRFNRG
jgi:ParB-like chromosome segregation protein Spo0J